MRAEDLIGSDFIPHLANETCPKKPEACEVFIWKTEEIGFTVEVIIISVSDMHTDFLHIGDITLYVVCLLDSLINSETRLPIYFDNFNLRNPAFVRKRSKGWDFGM